MKHQPAGFVLVEVILASALFLFLVVALGGAMLYGQEATALAGNRARAVFLADEGLEVMRNIRDEDYLALTNGTYGLVASGGAWTLVTGNDVTDIFTRTIVVADADTDTKEITATVAWPQNAQRQGEIILITRLTGWTVPPPPPPEPPPTP